MLTSAGVYLNRTDENSSVLLLFIKVSTSNIDKEVKEMIHSDHNFEEGVQLLTDDYDKDINSKMLLQGSFLNSDRFNETMKNIEEELNILYEKTRVLEDMIAYSKEFLEQEIHINKEKIYDKLKVIEESRDTLKESSYISYRVPIQVSSSEVVRDRDGTIIDRCDIGNGNLILSGQELEDFKIVDVTKKQELTAYNDNLEVLKDGGSYRVLYFLDGPAKSGVKEEITFMFEEAKKINYISASLANCTVLNASFINENGVEEQVIALENSVIAERVVKGVKLTIISTENETLAYDIDRRFVESDFWDNVVLMEHQRLSNQKKTFDLERASGMDMHKKDYAKYLKELEEWKADKKAIEERNRLAMMKYDEEYREWERSQWRREE